MARRYDWGAIIDALSHNPHSWFLTFPDWNLEVVKTVRFKRNPALRRRDGALEVTSFNHYTDPAGKRRGNVYLRWVPTEGDK